ncbi:MAG: NADH-quinone oxidoreductase subunit N [bacterium]|jgi:NADH-quinone oxidoreductase subunit N
MSGLAPQGVNFAAFSPVSIITAGIILTLLLQFAVKGRARIVLPLATLAVLAAAFVANSLIWNRGLSSFDGSYSADNFTLAATGIFLVATILTVLAIAARYCPFSKSPGSEGLFGSSEVFPLILSALAGAIVMAASRNLILTFLALETLSIPLYVLAGINLDSAHSKEAGLKYFLTGAFASGFFAYGISLFYGAIGALDYSSISENSAALSNDYTLFAGLALVAVGFGFKVALVPFHAWMPDVYQGSPTLVTGFMAGLVKAAGFAAAIRFFAEPAIGLFEIWGIALMVLAVATMTAGNLFALNQSSLKRLLAYSSVAHAGYLLVAVIALGSEWTGAAPLGGVSGGEVAALFYLAGYAASVIGAFTTIWWLTPRESEGALLEIEHVRGLARRHPMSAWMLAFFLLSLAGFPLTAGFLGKFYVFASALHEGLVWLVVVGLLNAVVSAYYYLKVIVAMFMQDAQGDESGFVPIPNGWIYAAVCIAAILVLWLGVVPQKALELLANAGI